MTPESHVTHSPETEPLERKLSSTRSAFAQWFGIVGGPLAMLGNLQAQYALVPWACSNGRAFTVHIPPIVFLLVAGAAAVAARHEWRAGGGGHPGADSGVVARARFLGALGFATSVFFALIIAAMWMADVFLNTCDGS
jgi:hypothetical protein